MSASEKFSQPDDGIIVTKAIDQAALALVRGRVAAGEGRDKVIADVALQLAIIETDEEKLRTASSGESPLHRAADANVPKLTVAIRYAFAHGRKALGKPPDAERAARAVAKALAQVIKPALLATLKAGGDVAVKTLRAASEFRALWPDASGRGSFAPGMKPADGRRGSNRVLEMRTAKGPERVAIKFKFNAVDEDAVAWADRHAAELVTQISETTRDSINTAIAGLLEGDSWEDAYDEILAAVGDEDRATLIARHETMMAASEGQRQAWDQAVEEGLLTGDEKRTWIVTPDEKLCPICEDLDGQVVGLNESYESDGEQYDGPPAHVQCRCTEGLA